MISCGLLAATSATDSGVDQSSSSGDLSNDYVHTHVTCDQCGVSPIVGIRYKCTVRDNFDLCERCERSMEQPYPLIKIRCELLKK